MLVPAHITHSLLIGTVYPQSRHAMLLTPLNLITCIVCMKQLLVWEDWVEYDMKNYTDGEGIFLFWQLQVFFKAVYCHLLSGT